MQQQSNIDWYHQGHIQTGARRSTKWPAHKIISEMFISDTAPVILANRSMSVELGLYISILTMSRFSQVQRPVAAACLWLLKRQKAGALSHAVPEAHGPISVYKLQNSASRSRPTVTTAYRYTKRYLDL